jgi:hypothetical protein
MSLHGCFSRPQDTFPPHALEDSTHMDSAHLVLVRQNIEAVVSHSTPPLKPAAQAPSVITKSLPSTYTAQGATNDKTQQQDVPQRPPPLPSHMDASPTMEVLVNDINRCLHGIDVTSKIIGSKFAGLMSSSQAYLESVATATGDHCDLMLQATSFLDFQADIVCRSGMTMLSRMKDLHHDMHRAKELLADIQQANASMKNIEEVLAGLERERGILGVSLSPTTS